MKSTFSGIIRLKRSFRIMGGLFFFRRSWWFLLRKSGISGTMSHEIVQKVNNGVCEGSSDEVEEKLQNMAKATSPLR